MTAPASAEIPRPVRVVFPVRVSFSGAEFRIREFTANLSVGGIFLPTENEVEPLTRGTLTFRISQWDTPFTVQAEVVRVVPAGAGQPRGLGIRFIDLLPKDRKRLERLVDGIRDGSVSQAIRRSIQEENTDLLQELRRRSMDQKVIFALNAKAEEIDALIRDGVPAVVIRLLENPRISSANVKVILRDPRVNTRTLLALRRKTKWMTDEENRFLFCIHHRAPLQDALNLVAQLSTEHLKAIGVNAGLRKQIRSGANLVLSQRSRSGL